VLEMEQSRTLSAFNDQMQMQLEKQASCFIWISLFKLLCSLSLLKII